jgi:hypothetical protein
MKASYRKTKTGFYPVIIFNNKSRMTQRVQSFTKDSAIRLAESVINDIINVGIISEYQEK